MAQILILFNNEQDRRLLNAYLSIHYDVHAPSPSGFESALTDSYDLCILDHRAYGHFFETITETKKKSATFTPFLLVVLRTERMLKQEAASVIDDMLVMPVGREELRKRVEILLRTRSISVKLYDLLKSHELMLSVVSHDIRSPLTAIQLQAQLLIESNVRGNSTERNLPRSILNNAKRIDRMIADLMDLGQKEIGDIEVKRSMFSLKEFLSNLIANEYYTAGAERIRVEIPNDFPRLMADPDRLERVFTNLINNSLNYAPDSDIIIRSRTSDDNAIIEITDYGPGIDPVFIQRIFERYYRIKETQSSAKGFGLGLYITRLIIEAHGGSVWARSEPGKGTTFSFTLPLKEKLGKHAA